ncbi:hypothetical protein E1B28_000386 [Marasmius oreades]|uniref:Uncharacterized protein n=1 Tax=Marasmius oreades TaxID=181124 RepID=A0A9P7V1A8_9AGAR|nr:uncharacterized protein E1B28_000386 [Marasmius oreades]KAG7098434.1 hypothetical protein E1B28_000386 [Marasmius oreades]
MDGFCDINDNALEHTGLNKAKRAGPQYPQQREEPHHWHYISGQDIPTSSYLIYHAINVSFYLQYSRSPQLERVFWNMDVGD